jgi:hypothetical protein
MENINDKKIWFPLGEHGVKGFYCLSIENLKESIKELKEEWRAKCKRMDIMSGDVAILELESLIEDKFGDDLV